MSELDFDPTSMRDWMAAVGLLRIITETTENGQLQWSRLRGRHRLLAIDLPDDMAARGVRWIDVNRNAWSFAGRNNVDFDAEFWRSRATGAGKLEGELWCAVASDAVQHRTGTKVQASGLEYAHGGGHQHWLASMREFLLHPHTTDDFARVLRGERNERMEGSICRWDPACQRNHAYRAKAPTKDAMTQDQTVNALAAIGFASCPSAPASKRLVSPLVRERGMLHWPIWTDAVRLPTLEAALCCGWSWPTVQSRRWLSGKLFCFSSGELREPEASG